MISNIFEKKSIKRRLGRSVLIVLFIQGLFLAATIYGGGTIKKLSDEYLKILNDHVIGRKNDIEKVMVQQWSNVADFEAYIQEEVEILGLNKNQNSMRQFLEHIAPRTVSFLRQRGVTGVFVILENQEDHEGFYIEI